VDSSLNSDEIRSLEFPRIPPAPKGTCVTSPPEYFTNGRLRSKQLFRTLLFLKNNHNRILRISMSINTFVGYSSNDFFYEKPDYCGPKTDGKYNTETVDINGITPENENKNENDNKTLCITNEKYGKLLKENKNETVTADSRYEYTLQMYNRELLRTVNYVAGIAFLGAYIYVNQFTTSGGLRK